MIKIEIKEYLIKIRITGDHIIELHKNHVNSFYREREDMGVGDRTGFRNRFIEDVAKEITNTNKTYEREARLHNKTYMKKLIINHIS